MPRGGRWWIWLAVLAIHGGTTSWDAVAKSDDPKSVLAAEGDILLRIRVSADGRVDATTVPRPIKSPDACSIRPHSLPNGGCASTSPRVPRSSVSARR